MEFFIGLFVLAIVLCVIFIPAYFIVKYLMQKAQDAVDRLVQWSNEDDEDDEE